MGALLFHLHYGRVVSTAALVSTADRSSPTVEKPVVVDRQIQKGLASYLKGGDGTLYYTKCGSLIGAV
jgi:hypothetical protein